MLEPLEPRLLLSADLLPLPEDGPGEVLPPTELDLHETAIELRQEEVAELHEEPAAAVLEETDAGVEAAEGHDEVPAEDTEGDPAEPPPPEASKTSEPGDDDAQRELPAEPGLPTDEAQAQEPEGDAASGPSGPIAELQAPSQLVIVDSGVPELPSLLEAVRAEVEEGREVDAGPAGEPPDAEARGEEPFRSEAFPELATTSESTLGEAQEPDLEAEIAALRSEGVEVVVLDPQRDGVEQVQELLGSYQGVAALHLVAHENASGVLRLGSTQVAAEQLARRVASQSPVAAVSPDVQLYTASASAVTPVALRAAQPVGGVQPLAAPGIVAPAATAPFATQDPTTGIVTLDATVVGLPGLDESLTLSVDATTGDLTLTYDDGSGPASQVFSGVIGLMGSLGDGSDALDVQSALGFGLDLAQVESLVSSFVAAGSQVTAVFDALDELVALGQTAEGLSELASSIPGLDDSMASAFQLVAALQDLADVRNALTPDPNTGDFLLNELLTEFAALNGLGVAVDLATDASGAVTEFGLRIQQQVLSPTFDYALDFGSDGTALGLKLGGQVTLSAAAQIDLDLEVGYDATVGDGYLQVHQLTVGGEDSGGTPRLIDGSVDVGLQVGFLDAQVVGGTFQLDARADLLIGDTDGDGAPDRVLLANLANAPISIRVDAAASNLTAVLPIVVSGGLDAASAAVLAGQTVTLTVADPFAGGDPSVDLDVDLQQFTNVSPETMLALIREAVESLAGIGASQLLDLEIPFVDGQTVGDLIDFAAALEADLLQQLTLFEGLTLPDTADVLEFDVGSATAGFEPSLFDLLLNGRTYQVTVDLPDPTTPGVFDDAWAALAADALNAGIASALGGIGDAVRAVAIERTSNIQQFALLPGIGVSDFGFGPSAAADAGTGDNGFLSVLQDAPFHGLLGRDLQFRLFQPDGTPLDVFLNASNTLDNLGLSDLIEDIRQAVQGTGGVFQVSEANGLVSFLDANGAAASIGSSALRQGAAALASELGFGEPTDILFTSLTELTNRLAAALLPGGTTLEASYDAATKELTFDLQWTTSLPQLRVPVDFDLNLAEIASIESDSLLLLGGDVTLDFTFGVDLDADSGADLVFAPDTDFSSTPATLPRLFDPNAQGYPFSDFVLATALDFTVQVFGLDDPTDPSSSRTALMVAPVNVLATDEVRIPSPQTNPPDPIADLDDLISRLQGILNFNLNPTGLANAPAVRVVDGGDRLELVSGAFTDSNGTVWQRTVVEVTVADPANAAVADLGLIDTSGPAGVLSNDARFTFIVDGETITIDLPLNALPGLPQSSDNQTLADLAADLTLLLRAGIAANPTLVAAGVDLEARVVQAAGASTAGTQRLEFVAKNVKVLRIPALDDAVPEELVAIDELGFPRFNKMPGMPAVQELVLTSGETQTAFLEQAELSSTLFLDASGLELSAALGPLGITADGAAMGTLGGVNGITGNVSLSLMQDPTTGRVELGDLRRELLAGNPQNVFDLEGDVTVDLRVDVFGSLQILDQGNLVGQIATLDFQASALDWLANPPVPSDRTAPSPISVQVNPLSGLDNLFSALDNLSITDAVQALNDLAQVLSQFEALSPFLAEPLPIVNASVLDVLDTADQFATLVEGIQDGDPQSLDVLETMLEEALGLDPTAAQILSLELDAAGEVVLRMDIDFGTGVDLSRPLELDLLELADLAGLSLPSGFDQLVGAGASGEVNFRAGADLGLAIGVSLSDPTDPFLILADSALTFSAAIEGRDLDLSASLGGFGLFIRDGAAQLGGSFTLGLSDDDSDGRLPFALASSHFATTVAGGATATLPVFFPLENQPLGDATKGENLIDVGIADLGSFLSVRGGGGGPSSVTFSVPDLASLFTIQRPSLLGLLANPGIVIDGLDRVLLGLDRGIEQIFSQFDLPVIGDVILNATDSLIEDLRTGILQDIADLLRGPDGQILSPVDLIAQGLTDALGAGGLDWLTSLEISTGMDASDARIITAGDEVTLFDRFVQYDLVLQPFMIAETFSFDLGLPGISLDMDGGITFELLPQLNLGFGIDEGLGLYLVADDRPDLVLTGTALLPSAIHGQLGILDFDAIDIASTVFAGRVATHPLIDANGASRSGVFVQLTGDVNDKNLARATVDGRLTLTELAGVGSSFGDLVKFDTTGKAELALDIATGFAAPNLPLPQAIIDALGLDNLGKLLPSLQTDMVLEWTFLENMGGSGGMGGGIGFSSSPERIEFLDVQLDLGSLVDDFLTPLVDQVDGVLQPAQDLFDLLRQPVPIISDLGPTVTFLDLAKTLLILDGKQNVVTSINAFDAFLSGLDRLDTALEQATAGIVSLGDLDLSSLDFNQGDVLDAQSGGMGGGGFDPMSFLSGASTLDQGVSASPALSDIKTGKFFTDGTTEFRVPLLSDPTQAIFLLLGQTRDAGGLPITLFELDAPTLLFDVSYRQFFPIWGPLGATLAGSFGGTFDFAFGYDLFGLEAFRRTGDPFDLLGGLFMEDVPGPEATIRVSIAAGAALSVGVAGAGVEGGIRGTLFLDINDPDQDGRVRISEMLRNVSANTHLGPLAPVAIFDATGQIDFFLRAYLDVLFVSFEYEIASATLFEFDIPFQRDPILAHFEGDDLILHVGELSGLRLHGNTDDIGESLTVTSRGSDIFVSGFGATQRFGGNAGVTTVVGDFGEGNDRLLASGLGSSFALDVAGGLGNDLLVGGAGDDLLRGGEGSDRLEGNGGMDTLEGGLGGDTLLAGAGADTLLGGMGDDVLDGGADSDRYVFAADWGHDTLTDSGGLNDVLDFGDILTDIAFTIGGPDPDAAFPGFTPNPDARPGRLLARSLNNSVSHPNDTPTAPFGGPPNMQIEEIRGGFGSDAFDVFQTGTTEIVLVGGGGSDDYIIHFQDPAANIDLVTAVRDLGPEWNTDVFFALGTLGDDVLRVDDEAVEALTNLGDPTPAAQRASYNKFPDGGLEQVLVQGRLGDDQIQVVATPAPNDPTVLLPPVPAPLPPHKRGDMSIAVSGGDGNDAIIVGGPYHSPLTQPPTLNRIFGLGDAGPLRVSGDAGTNVLLFDDTGDVLPGVGTLRSSSFEGLGVVGKVDYDTFAQVFVGMGLGGDDFTVESTHMGETFVFGGPGSDRIHVQGITGSTEIHGGLGNDLLDVGSRAPDPNGIVARIGGPLLLDGGVGFDEVDVYDRANGGGNDGTLTETTLDFKTMRGRITYGDVEDLDIFLGRGRDVFNVQGTSVDTSVFAGAGDDLLNVSSDAPANGGTTDRIVGPLTLQGEEGDNQLVVSDAGSGRAKTVTLDAGLGGVGHVILGLSPATIFYDATGTFANGVDVLTGRGADAVSVLATRGDARTRVFLGAGADELTTGALQPGRDGVLVVHGGAGSDTVDASASDVAVGLVGEAGDDTLTGGTGNDVLFGDLAIGEPFDAAGNRSVRFANRPGANGDDTLLGGDGDDLLFGGGGSDSLFGENGSDVLIGDYGEVTYEGGFLRTIGTRFLFQGAPDTLNGGPGKDFIFGGDGGDRIFGNLTDDVIIGDHGQITLAPDGTNISLIRLAPAGLDLVTSTLFALFDPVTARFFALGGTFGQGVLPLGFAAAGPQGLTAIGGGLGVTSGAGALLGPTDVLAEEEPASAQDDAPPAEEPVVLPDVAAPPPDAPEGEPIDAAPEGETEAEPAEPAEMPAEPQAGRPDPRLLQAAVAAGLAGARRSRTPRDLYVFDDRTGACTPLRAAG